MFHCPNLKTHIKNKKIVAKKNFLLLFLMICSTSHYSYAALYNTIGHRTLEDLNEDQLYWASERKEAPKYMAAYLVPNENHPNVYQPVLAEKRGTLISVGTFRTLIGFTLGKFNRLIMLDLTKEILEFNREHLDFISEISKIGDLKTQRKAYYQKYHDYLKNYAKSDIKYYWQDDLKWEKITEALKQNRINVIRGNLEYTCSNTSLYKALWDLSTAITLDVSNVEDYVVDEYFADTLRGFMRLRAGKDLISVLVTSRKQIEGYEAIAKPPVTTDNWYYYYFPKLSLYINHLNGS